jgi:hypothetical protein
MKTSVLISSIAALYLLVAFAETTRRQGEDNLNVTSTENISIVTVKMATMLPGVIIKADRETEAGISIPVIPAEDFSYLKFDVTDYLETESANTNETEILPEVIEADYSYLKFNISEYSDLELTGSEITELPAIENNSISTPEPFVNEFEYLRFDVNDYLSNIEMETDEIGELPLVSVTTNGFSYLKFDVTKYYSSVTLSSDVQFELPEE